MNSPVTIPGAITPPSPLSSPVPTAVDRPSKNWLQRHTSTGIAVIVDVVYNHFGPQDLSMWQFDGWQENDKGGIYFYNDWRSTTPWADTRPDYGRSEVRQFIRDNVFMWLDEFGIDGLRWDATNFTSSAM